MAKKQFKTLAEFDEQCGCRITCQDCKHFNGTADLFESTCKRLDHKHICFAKGPFASYNCGAGNGTSHCICSDFELDTIYKLLREAWLPEWKQELLNKYRNKTICLCLDKDFETRYEVRTNEFIDNTFLDADGNLKWIRKQYYKRTRKTPTGYVFINEYPDGFIQENANQPILWEHVKEV